MTTQHHVRIRGYAKETTAGTVSVEDVPRGRRVGGAITRFVLLLCAAAVSILIPLAHFILVPSFLIAAFITLFQRLALSAKVVGARGTCPDCGLEQDLDVPRQWRLPVDVTCRGCQRRLTLTAA